MVMRIQALNQYMVSGIMQIPCPNTALEVGWVGTGSETAEARLFQ